MKEKEKWKRLLLLEKYIRLRKNRINILHEKRSVYDVEIEIMYLYLNSILNQIALPLKGSQIHD